jgi:hypothetical protein
LGGALTGEDGMRRYLDWMLTVVLLLTCARVVAQEGMFYQYNPAAMRREVDRLTRQIAGTVATNVASLSGTNWAIYPAQKTIDANTNWISGDGDAEGVFVDSAGAVYVSSNLVVLPTGAPIQTYINSMPEGGTIMLSPGYYGAPLINTKRGVSLIGAGVGVTILTNFSGQQYAIGVTNSNVIVSDLSIKSSHTTFTLCAPVFVREPHGSGQPLTNVVLRNLDIYVVDDPASVTSFGAYIRDTQFTIDNCNILASTTSKSAFAFAIGVVVRNPSNTISTASVIKNTRVTTSDVGVTPTSGTERGISWSGNAGVANILEVRNCVVAMIGGATGSSAIVNIAPSNVMYVYDTYLEGASTNLASWSADADIYAYNVTASNGIINGAVNWYGGYSGSNMFAKALGINTNVPAAPLHVAGPIICTTNYLYYVNATSWVAQTATINYMLTVRNSNSVITVITNTWTP